MIGYKRHSATMPSEVTLLLRQYQAGDANALDNLAKLVYPDLKALARQRGTRIGPQVMGATTLVQETFAKFLSSGQIEPKDRGQFFGLAATIMRRLIIDEVRKHTASKRDAARLDIEQDALHDDAAVAPEFLLSVDQALDVLKNADERLARVFECRYFAGLSVIETAAALELSERSTERLWQQARNRLAELL